MITDPREVVIQKIEKSKGVIEKAEKQIKSATETIQGEQVKVEVLYDVLAEFHSLGKKKKRGKAKPKRLARVARKKPEAKAKPHKRLPSGMMKDDVVAILKGYKNGQTAVQVVKKLRKKNPEAYGGLQHILASVRSILKELRKEKPKGFVAEQDGRIWQYSWK